jgi:hypothetical protein
MRNPHTQRYKEQIHIKIAVWISIGQKLSDDCIFAVDSCAIETTARLQMCWGLLGNRLRSLAKSAPDNHQRRKEKGRVCPVSLCNFRSWKINSGQRESKRGVEGLLVLYCMRSYPWLYKFAG